MSHWFGVDARVAAVVVAVSLLPGAAWAEPAAVPAAQAPAPAVTAAPPQVTQAPPAAAAPVTPALVTQAPATAPVTQTAPVQAAPVQAQPTQVAPAEAVAAPASSPAATPVTTAPVIAAPATPTPAVTPEPQAAVAPPAKPLLGALVRTRLDTLTRSTSVSEQQDATALIAFYVARGDQPIWISDGAFNDRAVLAIAEIKKANDWGLDASAFDLPDVVGTLSDDTAAAAEEKLSMAVLTYARHARGGRIEDPAKQLSSYLDRLPQLLEPKIVLDQIAASSAPDATLRGFHPKHPQFEKLRQKYLELLKSASTAAEIVRLPKGPQLVPGQKAAQVVLLRQRLNVPLPAGTAEAPADDTFYDQALLTAVKAFQAEKGLTPDGIVGNASRAALNDIDAPNPDKLKANMELWRWIPEDLGAMHIWVNLPEFKFQVVRDGKVIHEERLIAGLVDKQTPVFSAAMELVTIHPRWNVPDSIKVKELYPSLARGGTSFARQGLRLSKNGRPVDPESVDWGSADIRNFDVQQPPGAANVLGLVKFSFPNKHTVYMHDTPSKGLFKEASRPFSHGCMRVQNPVRLAEILLEADKGWTAEQVDQMINTPAEENPIQLDKKVPVHIAYFTEWINDAGEEQRFKDVYGHEERVILALEGRFDAIVRGPDHLAPVTYAPGARYASGNTLETFMNNLFGGF